MRLIVDAPAPGVWNMAVDEVLLDTAANEGVATLRFYRWQTPTLSLGYFQQHADRGHHTPSSRLPVVRRSTGGGALVHDSELTYALALPPGDKRASDATALTCLAHRSLISAVGQLSDQANLLTTCAQAIPAQGADEPFLCFLRRAEGDLLARDAAGSDRSASPDGLHKICGSAQRRRRGAMLQHGGVLVANSVGAPELLGLLDLGIVPTEEYRSAEKLYQRLQAAWAERLADSLRIELASGELTPAERSAAESLAGERFSADAWTRRR